MIGNLSPDRVEAWREQYDAARNSFLDGTIDERQARIHLHVLRFRGEALDIEIQEFKKQREREK